MLRTLQKRLNKAIFAKTLLLALSWVSQESHGSRAPASVERETYYYSCIVSRDLRVEGEEESNFEREFTLFMSSLGSEDPVGFFKESQRAFDFEVSSDRSLKVELRFNEMSLSMERGQNTGFLSEYQVDKLASGAKKFREFRIDKKREYLVLNKKYEVRYKLECS